MSSAYALPCIEFRPPLVHCRAMNTSWKTIGLTALGLAWLAAADAREDQPSGGRTLTILVLDYAGVSDRSLAEMETVSALLLFRAGIGTQWVHCVGHQHGPRPAPCNSSLEKGSIMLRILAAYTGGRNELGDPLGAAMVEAGYASIYISAIREHAAAYGITPGLLMAYAATHEIGHLLLGRSHASSGIMRAVWGRGEYAEMSECRLDFAADERQAMRRAVPVTGPQLGSSTESVERRLGR